ncbi:MAG: insulinase family protein [Clostridiaceae bacterium]|jgi:predicted Zn-dependent peptidase|nr:insulinase family protein [Clostridiaceae bacterium]
MRNSKNRVAVSKLHEKNGISFYAVQSDKFKTIQLDIFLIHPLQKEAVSENALFPYVLRRGCSRYATQLELALRLEELYGAGISAAVHKKGENQIIHLNSGFVADQFTSGNTNLFDEAGSLLLEVLTRPVLEEGLFRRDYFDQEKTNLIQRIQSRVNDKMHYALRRCLEEMCAGEPYAIYEDGDEEGAGTITLEGLMARYRKTLAESPMVVFISGNVNDKDTGRFIDKFSGLERDCNKSFYKSQVTKDVAKVRRIEEPMDVSQGQLCLGFRTQVEAGSPDYFPLAIYNSILGGGVQSKLFQNVREKESLAYYIFSRLEKFKGLLVACGGIDIKNKEKAEKIILEQMEAIRHGNISDLEIEAAKKSIETGTKSMQDSQGGMIDFYLSQLLAGDDDDIESFLDKLMKVEKEDVVRISEKITPDTVYFLTSLSGESTGEGSRNE